MNMNIRMVCFCVTALALSTSVASAGMVGDTINLNAFAFFQTSIATVGATTATVADPGPEFAVCVGPFNNQCVTSGMSGLVNISDQNIAFTFFGSTLPHTGLFVLQLSGFTDQIIGVTRTGGSLNDGLFGLASFNANSISFAGLTMNSFDAIGGQTITFNVAQSDVTAVPEPSLSLWVLLGLVMVFVGWRVSAAVR
jgi:hypothetical protein